MKYSENFERDFKWFMSVRHIFIFDGCNDYRTKNGDKIIKYSPNGVDGKKAFYTYDSMGKVRETKHPNILKTLLKIKGSINLQIKEYAQDRATGLLGYNEFSEICYSLNTPQWFIDAVENQKKHYYNKVLKYL